MAKRIRVTPTFLLTAGRSGSTLLMRLLNIHPNIHMWGEHGGFIGTLARSYAEIHDNPGFWYNVAYTGASNFDAMDKSAPIVSVNNWSVEWANNFSPETVAEGYRNLIVNMFCRGKAGATHVGFKEIRYGNQEATFLARTIPDARFLFLKRRPLAVIESQIVVWVPEPHKLIERNRPDALRSWITQALDSSERVANMIDTGLGHPVRYEDVIRSTDAALRSITDYLEIPDFDPDKIATIMNEDRSQLEGITQDAKMLVRQFVRQHLAAHAFDRRRYEAISRRLGYESEL